MRYLLTAIVLLAAGCYYPAYHPPAAHTPPAAPTGSGQAEVVLAGGAGTEVLAEGIGAVTAGVDIARDAALSDALRRAVEQGVGTFIDSETRVENFQLLSDRIYARARGYVSSYRVITEGREGDRYRVVVRAKVKTADIENDLAAIGVLLREQGRPRLMVVVRELPAGGSWDSYDPAMSREMLETMMIDAFQSKGFPVVDAATVVRNIEKEQLRLILAGDDRSAMLAGMKTGAEIVVAGTVERSAASRVVAGAAREFHRFRVSARAISVESGEVLGAAAPTVELPFSEDEARRRAADTTSAALISRILGGWTRRENVTIIQASNATFGRVQQLRDEIRAKLRGVTQVITRDLTGNAATLEVVSETSSPEVLDGLRSRGIAVPFEVLGLAGNRIEIRFTGGAQ
ncbi:MAG: flagellar assembly protein T N-terminal domain-containing protein [bacterium]